MERLLTALTDEQEEQFRNMLNRLQTVFQVTSLTVRPIEVNFYSELLRYEVWSFLTIYASASGAEKNKFNPISPLPPTQIFFSHMDWGQLSLVC
jgi:hypothetical protein